MISFDSTAGLSGTQQTLAKRKITVLDHIQHFVCAACLSSLGILHNLFNRQNLHWMNTIVLFECSDVRRCLMHLVPSQFMYLENAEAMLSNDRMQIGQSVPEMFYVRPRLTCSYSSDHAVWSTTTIIIYSLTYVPFANKIKPTNCAGQLPINQSIYYKLSINVLGGNWVDSTDNKFSSVDSYRQDLLPTCKAFP